MKKLALVGLVLAASIGTAGVAVAAEPTPAVKAAICATASVDAVSFPADGRVADAVERQKKAVTEQDRHRDAAVAGGLAVERHTAAELTALRGIPKGDPNFELAQKQIPLLVAVLAGNAERSAADDELERAKGAQKDAVDLEAKVAAFVGSEDFAAVKDRHCGTAPPPAPAPKDVDCDEVTRAEAQRILNLDLSDPNNLDVDNDGIACEVDQVRVVPRTSSGVDTGA